MSGPWEKYQSGPWTQYAEPAPTAPPKEESGFLRQVADVPLSVGRGALTGVRLVADAFGAGSGVSETIKGAEGYLAGLMSAQAKNDEQEIARIMKDAEDKGFGEQVRAGFQAFATAPVDLISQGLGTAAPAIVGMLGGKLLGAGALGARAIGMGVGAGMGAGTAKSAIYEATKEELIKAGLPEDQAEERAQLAQSYGGKNLDQILLSTGLGAFASGTGLESSIKNILFKSGAQDVAKKGALQTAKTLTGKAAMEAVPEVAQGSQEQLAQNIALQREGFDVPTMRGVAGAGTLEGLAGAGLGAAGGAFEMGARGQARAEADRILKEEAEAKRVADEAAAEQVPAQPEPAVTEDEAPQPPVSLADTDETDRTTQPSGGADVLSTTSVEDAEAKPEVPVADNYAILKQEQQRLQQQPKSPETNQLLNRIEERLDAIVMRDIENRRTDKEKSATSVFSQEELPPVERRGAVVAERDLAELQAKEGLPELTDFELQQAKKTARMAGRPSAESTEFLSKQQQMQKDMKSLEAKRNKIKTGGNLYKALEGQLDPSEVSDIAPDIKKLYGKGYRPLANPAGRGTFISELVEDGLLNDYLPSAMRPDSADFDAQASTEFLKRKLRTKNTKSEVSNEDATEIDTQIEQLQRSMDESGKPEISVSEVEPGEAASVERAATDQEIGDATDIRYKRATGKVGIGKQAVQDTVDTVKARWANAPEVVVAENMDDPVIPQEVRDHNKEAVAKGAKGRPQGFYYKGKAYVIADSIGSTNEAVEALMHEALGHFGLRGVFGPKMETVLLDVIKNRRAEVESKAEQYGLDPKNDKDMLEAAEEVLAVMAQTKPGLPFVKRALAVIRNFLRDLGFNIKMSDADLIEKYILPARAFVESGKGRPAEGKPAAMRKEAETEDVRYSREGVMEQPAAEPEAGQPKPTRLNIFGDPVLGSWSIQVDPKMELQDGLIYKMLDKNIDVKRIVEAVKKTGRDIAAQWNPYLQEELYHGRTANAVLEFQDKELVPFLKDMQEKGVTIGELEKYLLNRHAEDYNKFVAERNKTRPEMQDGGSSVATADARKYLADLDPETKAKYEALAKRIDGITKGTRDLLVETGYESAKTIKAWEETFPNYVPLMREEMDFDYNFGSFGTGRGFDVRRDFSRSAMGSKRNVVDIIGNVMAARNNAIGLTEKNRVAQAVYGLALEAPNPDFWMAINPDLAEVRQVQRVKENIAKLMARRSNPNLTDAERESLKSSFDAEYKKLKFAQVKAQKAIEKVREELVDLGIPEESINAVMQEPEQRILDPKKNEVVKRVNPNLRKNDYVLATRINGEKRYVFFNPKDPRSKRAATALKNLDAQDLGTALGMVAKVTRWMAAVNTQYNPIFGPYNFLRDMQAAALQLSTTELAGQQKEVAANVVPSLRAIYSSVRKRRKGEKVDGEMADLWKEFQKEGGQTGFRDNFSRTQDRTEALLNEMSKITEGKAKAGARAVFDWLSDYNDSLENAVRLSAYKVAKEKFKKEGFSDSEVKQKAASLAKNLTVNFNRKGDIATQMGALYAFFNAAMQGTARMIETLKGPMGKKIMAGGLLLGSMQAALMAAAGFDDEEPPEFVRSKNIVIPTGDGNYIAFPMPLGFHVIPGVSRILTEWTLSGFDDTARRITDLTGLFLDAFNPVGNAGWSVQTVTPTFLDPFVALGENRDWTGKPISKEDIFSLRPTPGYTRAREGANWLSTNLAEFLNYASGGTKYQPGVVSPTPEQIEYLVGQVFGGVGREAIKLTTTVQKTATGEDLPPYKIPLYGRFVGETKSSAAESNKFYKNMEKLNRLDLEIKGRREDREPVGNFMRENPETRLLPLANKTYKDVQALRKRRAALLERDAPRESIQAVERMITRKMQVLNDRVRAMEQ
jgi:hypothetical protein